MTEISEKQERMFAGLVVLGVIFTLLVTGYIIEYTHDLGYWLSFVVGVVGWVVFIASTYALIMYVLPALGYLVIDLPDDIREWMG